jgi:hypothetical protein
MSSVIVQPQNFSSGNITFSAVKVLDSGGKAAYMNYSGRKLLTQVGSLTLPYGLNTFDKQPGQPPKYSMDVSLRGYDENPKVKSIFDMLTTLDEFMVDEGVRNSKAWFKAELSRDVIKAFYTPCVKWAKDAEGNLKPYPPTFKINLKKRDGKFVASFYDEKKRPYEGVPPEDLMVKGAYVTAIVECGGLWISGSKFGLSWNAVQVRMDSVPDSIRGYAFVGDEEGVSSSSAGIRNDNRFSQLDEQDEDVSDNDDEVFTKNPAPAPAPAPAPSAPAPAKKQSVLSAVMPASVATTLDDEAEDNEPIAVPKKTTVTKKIISKSVVGKKV